MKPLYFILWHGYSHSHINLYRHTKLKVKVKVTLENATKAQRGADV